MIGAVRLRCRLAAVAICLLAAPLAAAEDGLEELKKNRGYLLLHTDVASKTVGWTLSSGLTIDIVPMGEDFQLIQLKKGSYQWEEISIPYFNLPRTLDLEDDTRWSFDVEPGVINYVGSLVVGEFRSKNSVDVRFLNRTAEIRSEAQERFPEHFQRYDFIYSGTAGDQFLELLNNATLAP